MRQYLCGGFVNSGHCHLDDYSPIWGAFGGKDDFALTSYSVQLLPAVENLPPSLFCRRPAR